MSKGKLEGTEMFIIKRLDERVMFNRKEAAGGGGGAPLHSQHPGGRGRLYCTVSDSYADTQKRKDSVCMWCTHTYIHAGTQSYA